MNGTDYRDIVESITANERLSLDHRARLRKLLEDQTIEHGQLVAQRSELDSARHALNCIATIRLSDDANEGYEWRGYRETALQKLINTARHALGQSTLTPGEFQRQYVLHSAPVSAKADAGMSAEEVDKRIVEALRRLRLARVGDGIELGLHHPQADYGAQGHGPFVERLCDVDAVEFVRAGLVALAEAK